MGLFSARCQHDSPRFQSRQWFSAEELKSFFSCLSTFLPIDDDWSCLASRPGTLFPFYCCTCLGKNKRLQIECVSDTPHYLRCSSDSSFVISPTTAALSVSSNSLKDPTWDTRAVGRGEIRQNREEVTRSRAFVLMPPHLFSSRWKKFDPNYKWFRFKYRLSWSFRLIWNWAQPADAVQPWAQSHCSI